MGVIALALFTNGSIDTFYIPTWVKVAAGVAIAAGTYVGGWRIMRTLGQRIYKMEPPSGFAAQATAGAVIVRRHHGSATRSRRRSDLRAPCIGAGVDATPLRRALGHRREHRRRLGPHDSGRRAGRGGAVLADRSDLLT